MRFINFEGKLISVEDIAKAKEIDTPDELRQYFIEEGIDTKAEAVQWISEHAHMKELMEVFFDLITG
jgi:hypothetical protein